jgi:uncharacterized protein YecE (DUF72 family)
MTEWRIGTAGWAIPRSVADAFPREGGTLERYAARLNAAEINSSFHRSHRPGTYERWAASVPADFRFAVKLPKAITHVRRLVECSDDLAAFAAEIAPLASRRGPVLVQLPPSLAFDADVADRFFAEARETLGGQIACEPRHASWFSADADRLLMQHRVARVAADPARIAGAEEPGGWPELAYFRLHGSPRTYWSAYDEAALLHWAERASAAAARAADVWLIFDNTAGGAAAGNALSVRETLEPQAAKAFAS